MYFPRRIILDVDTGSDDATAIILAALSDRIELAGLTTVWGNKGVDLTTRHTLMIVELLRRSIPVYKGCGGPMARGLYPQMHREHARAGIDQNGNRVEYHRDFSFPEPRIQEEKEHAVQFIIDTCRNSERKITLVGVGPLTNIGMALRIAPDIVNNIEEIVVMGGGIYESNSTICAEGNIFHDPEAAEIVLHSGAAATFVPLDATHRAALPREYIGLCEGIGTPVSSFFADILRQRVQVYNVLQPLWRPDIAPIHEALCIAYLIDPEVLRDLRRVHLQVCLDHGEGAGAFLIDTRHFHLPENATVAYGADCDLFGQIVLDLLQRSTQQGGTI